MPDWLYRAVATHWPAFNERAEQQGRAGGPMRWLEIATTPDAIARALAARSRLQPAAPIHPPARQLPA